MIIRFVDENILGPLLVADALDRRRAEAQVSENKPAIGEKDKVGTRNTWSARMAHKEPAHV